MKRRIAFLTVAVLAVTAVVAMAHRPRESRLSAVVAIVSEKPEMKVFLDRPGYSYMQSYVRFGDALGQDVIFGLDQELLDGVARPLYYPNGDWMSTVGLQRTGAVWVASGTPETMNGHPSKDRKWVIKSLGVPLKPNEWYRIREEADFSTRHYQSFSIDGPGIHQKLDLTGIPLDYPNPIPFSDRSMTYYVFAMRGRGMMKSVGTPLVYFDDAEGGVSTPEGRFVRCFYSDFELNTPIPQQKLTFPVLQINNYVQGGWYLEREESLFRCERAHFARSGKCVGVADVSLD